MGLSVSQHQPTLLRWCHCKLVPHARACRDLHALQQSCTDSLSRTLISVLALAFCCSAARCVHAYMPQVNFATFRPVCTVSFVVAIISLLAPASLARCVRVCMPQVNFAAFRGVGTMPFVVGAAGAAIVGSVGLTTSLLISKARGSNASESAVALSRESGALVVG